MFINSRNYCIKIISILIILLFTEMLIPAVSIADVPSEPIRILEIEPSTSFDISDSMQSDLQTFFNKSVEVSKMPMPLFVSKIEQVNGYYHIIYIGNNQNGG